MVPSSALCVPAKLHSYPYPIHFPHFRRVLPSSKYFHLNLLTSTMSWWSDFSKRASDVAKAATEKAAEVAKMAADKSKEVAETVHTKVNTFVEEQKKEYSAVEQESDLNRRKKTKKSQMMHSGNTPWFIDEKTDKQSMELLDELKVNILKLCEDEKNFLIKAPNSESVFAFKLEYALPHATKALELDPILPQIRFKMVPRRLKEEQFWKNYFYRVNVIRESLGISKMDFSKPPIATTPRAESPKSEKQDVEKKEDTNENKEDESKNSENEQNEKSKSKSSNKDILDPVKGDLSQTEVPKKSSSSEKMPDMNLQNVDATDLNMENEHIMNDDNEFLADDDLHIDRLSKAESEKMQKELGIKSTNETDDADLENVDDLLADVNTDDIDEMSDADLAKELENL